VSRLYPALDPAAARAHSATLTPAERRQVLAHIREALAILDAAALEFRYLGRECTCGAYDVPAQLGRRRRHLAGCRSREAKDARRIADGFLAMERLAQWPSE
jgi:hypothetical protein